MRLVWCASMCSVGVVFSPTPDQQQFYDLLRATNDSSPGPDGIPYKFWDTFKDVVGNTLYNFLVGLWYGDSPPSGFNSSFMVFLPKADMTWRCGCG